MVLLFSGVCMVSSGLSFLSSGPSNMSIKRGNEIRYVGMKFGHNWNHGSFISIIRVNGYNVRTYSKLKSDLGFSFLMVGLPRNDYSIIKIGSGMVSQL